MRFFFMLLALVLSVTVRAESDLSIHSGFFNAEGEDSGFSLDGDLDTLELRYRLSLTDKVVAEVSYSDRQGEFTLTTGGTTEYEATEIEALVGYTFCMDGDCDSSFTPYIGYRKFEAKNALTAFGVAINVDQERDIVPVGLAYEKKSGALEYGIDVSFGRKVSDDQIIPRLGVNQSSDDNWTYQVKVPVRYVVDEHFYVEFRYEIEEVRFSDSMDARFAREENSQFSFGAGYRF